MDTLGGMFAIILADMDCIGCILFVNFGYFKTVTDHAGFALQLPGFAPAQFHTIHHHHRGLHLNYQQPFFTFWDSICNTEAVESDFTFGEGKKTSSRKSVRTDKKKESPIESVMHFIVGWP